MADYWEVAPWPKGYWLDGHFYGERKVLCAWSDVAGILTELGSDPGWEWPYAATIGTSAAIARKASLDNRGKISYVASHYASYPHALLTIQYSTKGPRHKTGYLVEEHIRKHKMSVFVPPDKFAWSSGTGRYVDQKLTSKLLTTFDYELTYRNLSSYPANLAYVDTCNGNAMTCFDLGLVFAAQTMLYQLPAVNVGVTASGAVSYDVTYCFSYHPGGWNTFWNAENEAFESVYRVSNGVVYTPHPVAAWP